MRELVEHMLAAKGVTDAAPKAKRDLFGAVQAASRACRNMLPRLNHGLGFRRRTAIERDARPEMRLNAEQLAWLRTVAHQLLVPDSNKHSR